MLVVVMPFALVATAIAATGTVTVRVHDRSADGVNLVIPVPALLIDLAAFVVPRVIPDDALDEVRQELAPYREGLIAIVNAIEDCPSGTLVHFESADESVLVSKKGSRFHVSVDSSDLDVDVSVPARFARRALQMVDLM
jgi:hypothetical protein